MEDKVGGRLEGEKKMVVLKGRERIVGTVGGYFGYFKSVSMDHIF